MYCRKLTGTHRYTLTYTPSADRILPPPTHLHVKVKNTSAVPLRAAYLHGPYTLYVACYPSTFDANEKHSNHEQEGTPEFEPNLKAGGHWTAKLTVPEAVREGAGEARPRQSLDGNVRSFTWIIEVASQVLFSTTAAVHYELLVGRDERSVELGFHGMVGSGQGIPGKLQDHQQGRRRDAAQPRGVFSKAVGLIVEDTESLWNKPPFPEWDEDRFPGPERSQRPSSEASEKKDRKQQKVHLVLLTHGLHSNTGADMLYLKESIDNAAKQAREDARKRKAELGQRDVEAKNAYGRDASHQRTKSTPEIAIAPTGSREEDEEEDEEQVIVRGFNGNAVKTERGIQYLGKRFAKYVLSLTYPDQPYLPVKSSISKSITRSLTGSKSKNSSGPPSHKNSSIVKDEQHLNHNLAYRITSISFIAHSLGGCIQTYAIAYIQKHSPGFFDLIEPVNFVAMASPFLGLSNENPVYVKFALDFGLVGRTGRDLGLTWRTPTIARSGWDAVIGGLGPDSRKNQNQPDPGSKPLLRILPTGPAHAALKRFRNRSVYANVVNDGIVPLRTSCLLFLDWRGLGRVEKARRENGLVGTMVSWGWTEMIGQNASSYKRPFWNDLFGESEDEINGKHRGSSPDPGKEVPTAEVGEGLDEDQKSNPDEAQFLDGHHYQDEGVMKQRSQNSSTQQPPSAWASLMAYFKPHAGQHHRTPMKKVRMYRRGQTMKPDSNEGSRNASPTNDSADGQRGNLVRGASLYTTNSVEDELQAPPKTTFFESAGDVLNPPLPPKEFLLDPAARPRTIFHDRVYHPEDIPPPPTRKQRSRLRRMGSKDSSGGLQQDSDPGTASQNTIDSDGSGMKIEEKIARAYHKDLTWRKVLVRLEPDAHNNLIVRRMFANAYGWPVVKHLCDTHFAYTAAAQMRDEDEATGERAMPADAKAGEKGEEVAGQVDQPSEDTVKKEEDGKAKSRSYDDVHTDDIPPKDIGHSNLGKDIEKLRLQGKEKQTKPRSESEIRESRDELSDLMSPSGSITATGTSSHSSLNNSGRAALTRLTRDDSARWSDRFFEGDEEDSDEEDEEIVKEWNKAKARGEGRGGQSKVKIVPGQPLTTSPTQSRVDLTADVEGEQKKEKSVAIVRDPGHGSQPDMRALSLTGMGLSKGVGELVAGEDAHKSGGAGVAKQVAITGAKREAGKS